MDEVVVSVEPLGEKRIQEFLPSGGEVFVEALSRADLLSKNAQRLDFGIHAQPDMKTDAENGKDDTNGAGADGADKEKEKNKHPWEGATKHLRSALQEMSVLCDVLHISRAGHYLLPDPVSQPPVPSDVGLQLYLGKQNLSKAASILLRGASAVRSLSSPSSVGTSSESSTTAGGATTTIQNGDRHEVCTASTATDQPDNRMFYRDLQSLCTSWALRRNNHLITGDLALTPTDSSNALSRFEVERHPVGDSATRMEVSVNAELRSRHSLRIFSSSSAGISAQQVFSDSWPQPPAPQRDQPSWLQTLETAEESLICRDLFRRVYDLSNDAWCTYRVIRRSNWLSVQLDAKSWLHVVRITPSAQQASVTLSNGDSTELTDKDLRLEPELLSDLRRRYFDMLSTLPARPSVTTMLLNRRWQSGTGYVSVKPQAENLLHSLIKMTSMFLARRQLTSELATWTSSLHKSGVKCRTDWLLSVHPLQSIATVTMETTDVKPPCTSSLHISVAPDGIQCSASSGRRHKSICVDDALKGFLALCVSTHNRKLIRDMLWYWHWKVVGETKHPSGYRLLAFSSHLPSSELRIHLDSGCGPSRTLRVLEARVCNDEAGLRKTVNDLTALYPVASHSSGKSSIAWQLSQVCAHLAAQM